MPGTTLWNRVCNKMKKGLVLFSNILLPNLNVHFFKKAQLSSILVSKFSLGILAFCCNVYTSLSLLILTMFLKPGLITTKMHPIQVFAMDFLWKVKKYLSWNNLFAACPSDIKILKKLILKLYSYSLIRKPDIGMRRINFQKPENDKDLLCKK